MKRKDIAGLQSVLNKVKTQGLDGEDIWNLLTDKRKVAQLAQEMNAGIEDLKKELGIEVKVIDNEHIMFNSDNKENMKKFNDALTKLNEEDCGEFNRFLSWDKFVNWTNANNLSLDEVDMLSNAIAIDKDDSPLLKEKIKN